MSGPYNHPGPSTKTSSAHFSRVPSASIHSLPQSILKDPRDPLSVMGNTSHLDYCNSLWTFLLASLLACPMVQGQLSSQNFKYKSDQVTFQLTTIYWSPPCLEEFQTTPHALKATHNLSPAHLMMCLPITPVLHSVPATLVSVSFTGPACNVPSFLQSLSRGLLLDFIQECAQMVSLQRGFSHQHCWK